MKGGHLVDSHTEKLSSSPAEIRTHANDSADADRPCIHLNPCLYGSQTLFSIITAVNAQKNEVISSSTASSDWCWSHQISDWSFCSYDNRPSSCSPPCLFIAVITVSSILFLTSAKRKPGQAKMVLEEQIPPYYPNLQVTACHTGWTSSHPIMLLIGRLHNWISENEKSKRFFLKSSYVILIFCFLFRWAPTGNEQLPCKASHLTHTIDSFIRASSAICWTHLLYGEKVNLWNIGRRCCAQV